MTPHQRVADALGVLLTASDAELEVAIRALEEERIRRGSAERFCDVPRDTGRCGAPAEYTATSNYDGSQTGLCAEHLL